MMRCCFLCLWGLCALLIGTSLAFAREVTCTERQSNDLNKLEKVYAYKGIRVFWTQQPPQSGTDHRLPPQSSVDHNHNGIPDLVENIARQADAARRAYVAAGFPDPLDARRYAGVRFIDINVLKMKYNGLAYDTALAYPDAPGRGAACTLRIDVSSSLETGLRGPAGKRVQPVFTKHWFVVGHEMFHLFQYGLTQFKRSWINEPTAKWAEYALRRGSLYQHRTKEYSLPVSLHELQVDVIDAPTSVMANLFWSRLIELAGNRSAVQPLPRNLLEETYIDGEPIFKDDLWQGMAFIGDIYQALQHEENILSSMNNWNRTSWTERNQISSEHDSRLLMAIQKVLRNSGATGVEVNLFLDRIHFTQDHDHNRQDNLRTR